MRTNQPTKTQRANPVVDITNHINQSGPPRPGQNHLKIRSIMVHTKCDQYLDPNYNQHMSHNENQSANQNTESKPRRRHHKPYKPIRASKTSSETISKHLQNMRIVSKKWNPKGPYLSNAIYRFQMIINTTKR